MHINSFTYKEHFTLLWNRCLCTAEIVFWCICLFRFQRKPLITRSGTHCLTLRYRTNRPICPTLN